MFNRTNKAAGATLSQISSIEWFGSVGKGGTDTDIEYVGTWKQAIASCSSLTWINLRQEMVNKLRIRVRDISVNRFNKWNKMVDKLQPLVWDIVDIKTDHVLKSEEIPDLLIDTVRWDILNLLLEAEFSDIVAPAFYAGLSYWYGNGRFPCGWSGNHETGKLRVF